MRLIDADKLIEEIKQEIDMRYMYSPKGFINVINNQPTAFDVDKVVVQLEAQSEMNLKKGLIEVLPDEARPYLKAVESFDKAIKIVMEGGIDEKSKFKWCFAEDFYKELFKQLKPFGIRVCSPNKKTFYEAMAELDVEAYLKPQEPLTKAEQDFLFQAEINNYIKAFGLQDTSFRIGTHHRTTKHGTTEEPCIISSYDIEMAVTAQSFNRKDDREVEGYTNDEGFEVKSWNSATSSVVVSHQRERENIETLKWFLSLDKETQKEFLLPGWRFCPVCGKLYHELDGCYDGDVCHVEPIEFVPYNENHEEDEDE